MSRFLYACGLCIIGAVLALYIAILDADRTAWLCSLGFLAVGGFLWAADWIVSKTESPEFTEEE
ncbi:MAG: hypothetical protein KGL35_05945 [Bradyrhizobium sp.]|nr:hypothetical protein [Bradyrhizobium sp.]